MNPTWTDSDMQCASSIAMSRTLIALIDKPFVVEALESGLPHVPTQICNVLRPAMSRTLIALIILTKPSLLRSWGQVPSMSPLRYAMCSIDSDEPYFGVGHLDKAFVVEALVAKSPACPHSDMQCAPSIAMSRTLIVLVISTKHWEPH